MIEPLDADDLVFAAFVTEDDQAQRTWLAKREAEATLEVRRIALINSSPAGARRLFVVPGG